MNGSDDPERIDYGFNPYLPPTAAGSPVDTAAARSKPLGWLRFWSFLLLLTLMIGTPLAMYYSIESIVATGPFVLIFGLIVAAVGAKCRQIATTLVGVLSVLFVILVFGLINLNGWSPRDAEEPVPAMIALFDLIVFPLAIYGMIAKNPDGSGPRR